MTIDGPGAKDVTINGNNTFQDLLVDANVSASVSGLTITGGQGPATTYPYGGGGIFNAGTPDRRQLRHHQQLRRPSWGWDLEQRQPDGHEQRRQQ